MISDKDTEETNPSLQEKDPQSTNSASLTEEVSSPNSPLDRLDGEEPAFSLGAALRRARLRQNISLKDVEAKLRIRYFFLEAIEGDHFEHLPGHVYVTAFLRSYGELLGIPFPKVMERFNREAAEKNKAENNYLPSLESENSLPKKSIIIVGLLIIACTYGGWIWFSGGNDSSQPNPVVPLSPQAEEVLIKSGIAPAPATSPADQPKTVVENTETTDTETTDTNTADTETTNTADTETANTANTADTETTDNVNTADNSLDPQEITPPEETIFGTENLNPRIILKAENSDCWFRIREADGQMVSERVLHPGESYQVPNREGLTLSVGNAGGLRLIVDGTVLPLLGTSGQVRTGIRLNPDQLLSAN